MDISHETRTHIPYNHLTLRPSHVICRVTSLQRNASDQAESVEREKNRAYLGARSRDDTKCRKKRPARANERARARFSHRYKYSMGRHTLCTVDKFLSIYLATAELNNQLRDNDDGKRKEKKKNDSKEIEIRIFSRGGLRREKNESQLYETAFYWAVEKPRRERKIYDYSSLASVPWKCDSY